MNFTVIDAPQRSEAWFQARAGRLTGSVAAKMLAEIKSGEAAARRDLRFQLCCERLTGTPQEDGYVNAEMQRGIALEPVARMAYEAMTGQIVEESGFLAHTSLMAGCSLDGHVQHFTGIIELKCPKSATHYGYLREGGLPKAHVPQVLHNMWITGAAWCDFLSFDDRFPAELQVFYVRYERDEQAIADYAAKAVAFLEECDRELAAMRKLVAA